MFRAATLSAVSLGGLAAVLVACGSDALQFDDLKSNVRGSDGARPMCDQPTIPQDDSLPTDPTPRVTYPTPAGASVTEGITGIPLPPGSKPVDGYRSGETVTHVFVTDSTANEIFDFYDSVMREHGWFAGGLWDRNVL